MSASDIKAVKLIELDNTLIFKVDLRKGKDEIKTEFEKIAFLLWKSGEIHQDLEVCSREIENGAKFSLDSRREFFEGIYADVTGA